MSTTENRKITAAERRALAIELRKAGHTFREIAEALGCSVSVAHGHVRAALADLADKTTSTAAQLRELEGSRMDALIAANWRLAMGGDTAAAGVVLRASERRSKLYGLDGPVKVASTDPEGQDHVQWVMPMPPVLSVEEWTAETQRMLAGHRERADELMRAAGIDVP